MADPVVLYSTLFGSHLYGTNTPASDRDIKRVVLPDLDSVLLGRSLANKVLKTNTAKHTKNTAADVDQEDIPLQVFISDFVDGQTYALELANSIEGSHAEQTFYRNGALAERATAPFYKLVITLRASFLTSNVKAMMGYVFNQANIYSFKGERLNCAREFHELLRSNFTDTDAGDDQLIDLLPDPGLALYKENLGATKQVFNSYAELYGPELGKVVEEQRDALLAKFKALEAKYPKYFRISEYDIGGGRQRPCFVLLEKTFPWTNTLTHSLQTAEVLISKYGSRANQASEQNVDWKAMMHAVRIIDEGLELLTTKSILLPRPPETVARLLQIKRGELPLEPLKDELVEKLNTLKDVTAACGLPASTDPQLKANLERFTLGWLYHLYDI